MTAGLLLDTCAIIWVALRQPIKDHARAAMNASFAADERVRVSPISAWELGLLASKGRLASVVSPKDIFDDVVTNPGIKIEGLSPDVLIASSFLPGTLHRDPADRILVATARALDLTIVTRDRAILDYAGQGHVRALDC